MTLPYNVSHSDYKHYRILLNFEYLMFFDKLSVEKPLLKRIFFSEEILPFLKI